MSKKQKNEKAKHLLQRNYGDNVNPILPTAVAEACQEDREGTVPKGVNGWPINTGPLIRQGEHEPHSWGLLCLFGTCSSGFHISYQQLSDKNLSDI